MNLTGADFVHTLVAGLAGGLGVYLLGEALGVLRRYGMCPERWRRNRSFLVRRGRARGGSWGHGAR
ncbi:hypothetical protein GCM10010166_61220 [Couchioplanes caeruleus subsp. azureus]|nr:hypothetical protein GCM10010166_61220 [Couchioplanes caeruleus subsp. azureus]